MALAVLVVRELGGSCHHLVLRVLNALFHIVEGDFKHLPFYVSEYVVPERGKRTYLRRWSGESA